MLGLWVRNQNFAGASIRTPILIAEFQAELDSLPPPAQLRSVPHTDNSTGRNRAFRWRRSQGCVFGKIPTQEPVSMEELREKASALPPASIFIY